MRHFNEMRRDWPLIAGMLVILAFGAMDVNWLSNPSHPVLLSGVFCLMTVLILLCAFRALHHVGALAERFGEPYGSLLLTLSILSIEVSLIASVMLTGSPDPTLARDTMFAGFMLTMNGVVGVVVVCGGLRHRQQEFNLEGARAYLAALIPLAITALILPNFTRNQAGALMDAQAIAIGVATVVFYGIFLGVQTMRHREFFIDPHERDGDNVTPDLQTDQVAPHELVMHFAMLFFALLIIAFLGRELAKTVDFGIHRLGVPVALGGILIATLTLTPESVSAFRAALEDKLQHSVNVFLGGALSTIGLTVPCVLIVGVLSERRVILGLQGTDMVLLLLTLFVSSLTFGGVRTNMLQGVVHLLLFFLYLVFIFYP